MLSPIGSAAFAFFKYANSPLYTGTLMDNGAVPDSIKGDSLYTAIIPVNLIRSDIGTFYVELSANDTYGNRSTAIRLPFTITRLNQPPVIFNLTAPDTLHTSVTDPFIISVQASDPDGPGDIRSVTRTTPQGNVWPLNDAGQNGDAAAGDGTYTERVSPPPDTGSYVFKFQAFDRSGVGSNIIYHTIVVVP